MSPADVKHLPLAEKFQLMEAIWNDLKETFDSSNLSPEIAELLRQRRERVVSGEARLVEWDEVKDMIGRP